MFSVQKLENVDKPKNLVAVSRDPVSILTSVLPYFFLCIFAYENVYFYKVRDHSIYAFL